jgi:hypothetical protein
MKMKVIVFATRQALAEIANQKNSLSQEKPE